MSTVRREIVLPVERERAWALLTEPAELREWLADEVELEPEAGAPLRVAWAGGEAREGVVEEVEEERRLRFRWDDDATGVPSRVEWTLDDAPGGTRVVVVERPLVPLELRGVAIPGTPWRRGSRRSPRARSCRRPWRAAGTGRRRRLRGARGPDPPRGHRPAGAGAARAPRALAGELPVSRQAVAKHLAALDRAGLVAARREGRETRYRSTPAPMGEAMAWMAGVGARWDERLARLRAPRAVAAAALTSRRLRSGRRRRAEHASSSVGGAPQCGVPRRGPRRTS